MTSYKGKQTSRDNSEKMLLNIVTTEDKIPSKNMTELNHSESFNKNKVTLIENLTSDKIEKSISFTDHKLLAGLRVVKDHNLKQNNLLRVQAFKFLNGDSHRNSLNQEKIEEQKLKKLPITTCMKKNIYDYEGKNNLNSEISSNYKEMEFDNVFSDLLNKVKEKKEKKVEPKRLSEISFNNYVNKGPLRFFNVVINRKIPENQCSSAFLPNKKFGLVSRSSQSSMNSNFAFSDLINKKIIDEKNKLIKNEYNVSSEEESKRSAEEMRSLNKNSIYDCEKDTQKNFKNSKENFEFVKRFVSSDELKKAITEKSSIPFTQVSKENKNIILSSAPVITKNFKPILNDDKMKMYNFKDSNKEFQVLNSHLEHKENKVIEQITHNKFDLLKATENLSSEISKKYSQNFEISSKNNNLNESLSNETTKTNSNSSPTNTLFFNIGYKPMINLNALNIDRGILKILLFYLWQHFCK